MGLILRYFQSPRKAQQHKTSAAIGLPLPPPLLFFRSPVPLSTGVFLFHISKACPKFRSSSIDLLPEHFSGGSSCGQLFFWPWTWSGGVYFFYHKAVFYPLCSYIPPHCHPTAFLPPSCHVPPFLG